ncbi:MAG TPA: TetR family transcriptional regulator C-terminal domain-containing protein [Candidatus Obscuribacterales bacterium]
MPKRAAVKDFADSQPVRPNIRAELIQAGTQIMLEKGFNNTGIAEVLTTVGVPKGSFYYYFESKEEFGLQIINTFDEDRTARLDHFLGDKSTTPIQRLKAWCEDRRLNMQDSKCRKGCLIGNLSQEMADQSEVFRARLEEILTRWRNKFAACIKEGQTLGQITSEIDAVDLAEFFLSGWEGSLIRTKTTKNTGPQEVFIRVIFSLMLPPQR